MDKFYSKFLGGEREQKNSKFEANSFKMLKHKNPFLIVFTAEFRIEAFSNDFLHLISNIEAFSNDFLHLIQ